MSAPAILLSPGRSSVAQRAVSRPSLRIVPLLAVPPGVVYRQPRHILTRRFAVPGESSDETSGSPRSLWQETKEWLVVVLVGLGVLALILITPAVVEDDKHDR